MQPAPRPLASVPLGGSLRASRATLLARPHGPLAAVDLADGHALMVEDLGAGWVACPLAAEAAAAPLPHALEESRAPAAPPVRRRRLGTALALAGALGAAAVALAAGFSGTPAPAVAGPIAHPGASPPPALPAVRARARGGRATALARAKPPPPPPAATAAPPAVVAPPAVPVPPPLPELPSAPAL